MNKTPSEIKQILAQEAALQVQSGMIVGLGSGTTATEFIKVLGKRFQDESLDICAVPSSLQSQLLAKSYAIPLVPTFTSLDLVVDGADEVDPSLRLIKGGGGALLRESILIQAASRTIILVDEGKCVNQLGTFPLPIEVSPFGYLAVEAKINQLGYCGVWRSHADQTLFRTDNNNYIYEVHFPNHYPNPEEDLQNLIQIHGIIAVGFVIADVEVWVGHADGSIAKKCAKRYGNREGTT